MPIDPKGDDKGTAVLRVLSRKSTPTKEAAALARKGFQVTRADVVAWKNAFVKAGAAALHKH